MRGIKPFKLSFVTRPFSWGQSHHLGVGVIGYFPLTASPTLLGDMEMWTEVPEVLGKEAALDVGIPKSRAELLVSGSAYQPGGVPGTVRFVRAKVGALEKTLNVIGDRYWRKGVPTAPLPFTEMPLTWEHAFGGEGFAENPQGKGFAPVKAEGEEVHPLPNVELPGHMIDKRDARPPPASFGPIDFTRPSRLRRAGTYDKRWLDTRFPGFAEDMDWRIWNVASEDQWQDEPFRGDEEIVLEHLHPTRPKIESRLPNVRGRCFLMHRVGETARFVDVPLKLTTVWLLPSIERGVVIFHGAHPIAEDDGRDVEVIMVAAERADEPPRDLEHYRAAYERRTGPDGMFEVFNEADLMPTGMEGVGEGLQAKLDLAKPDQLVLARRTKAAKAKVEATREELRGLGLDPDVHGPKSLGDPPPMPGLTEIGDFSRKAIKEAEASRDMVAEADATAAQEMIEIAEKTGMDLEELKKEVSTPVAGPPTFTAAGERRRIRKLADEMHALRGEPVEELEHYSTSDEVYARFVETEHQLKEIYRQTAHLSGVAPKAPENASRERREHVIRAHASGESLADWDLTGVDLSGVDLRGADLTRSFLESADLSGATLDGATFENTVLARANLRGASLIGARLPGANLGGADLSGAVARGAILTGALLDGTRFTGADLRDADLTEAAFGADAQLGGARFAGALLRRARLFKMRLGEVSLAGADLTDATFFEADATGVCFDGATLQDATFFRCTAEKASFLDAKMVRFRAIESALPGADFKRADLEQACLRGADLRGADLGGARLTMADLSEANLTDARLYRIVARRSMWVRTVLKGAVLMSADLFEAILEKADIRGADLRGANLYGANFALVRSDDATDVHEAIQDKVRVLPLREPPPPEAT